MNFLTEVVELDIKPSTRKLVLIAIAKYSDNSTGISFPSISTIMKIASCGKTAAHEHLKALIDQGYISKRNNSDIPKELRERYKLKSNHGCYLIHKEKLAGIEMRTSLHKELVRNPNRFESRTSSEIPHRTSSESEPKLNKTTQEKPPLKGGQKEVLTLPLSEEIFLFGKEKGLSREEVMEMHEDYHDYLETHPEKRPPDAKAMAADFRRWVRRDYRTQEKQKQAIAGLPESELCKACWEEVLMVADFPDGHGVVTDHVAQLVTSELGGISAIANSSEEHRLSLEKKFKERYMHYASRKR